MSKNLIVLLARQRSGTNVVRAVLNSHPEIHCFEEVLNPDAHYLDQPWSFFNFLKSNCTVSQLHPSNHLTLFAEFVEHLHTLHGKPNTLIDLKHNTCSHVSANWRPFAGESSVPVFDWIKSNGIPVVRLRRRNYLRVAVSHVIANQRKKWLTRSGETVVPLRISLPLEGEHGWLTQMRSWRLEDQLITHHFHHYDRLIELEYADLFPHLNHPMSPEFLDKLGQFLNLPASFSTKTWCVKSNVLPLRDTLVNWTDVVKTLRNSEFDYCLEDEPMFHGNREIPHYTRPFRSLIQRWTG